MKKYLTRENIFYSMILFIFIGLSIFISLKHEYWADEANAWLLAQDLSIKELIMYIHHDGHPILFHLIIKLFCLFGLKYEYFSIISITFSSLGVYLFLFKSKFKWYLKLLIPFTYFIFYQYTIVVRGYCLVLFLLSLVAIFWKKRREKCVLFTIILTLLLSSEVYTFLIAGSIYLIFIIDYIEEFLKTKKHNKKYLLCLIFLFIAFLLTTLYVYPRSSNSFNPTRSFYFISDSFITTYKSPTYIRWICTILISLLFFIIYIGTNKRKIIEALIIITPVLLFMFFKYSNLWHFGIIFILFIFLIWIHELEDKRLLNVFLIITSLIQIYYSINTSIYDYNNNYDSSRDAANFIKKYDYSNMKIYGDSFYASGINAYFDKNIYFNWDKRYRFFYWDKNSYYNHFRPTVNMIKANNVDIFLTFGDKNDVNTKLLEDDFNIYTFDGYTYFENSKYEVMDCYVFVRRDKDIQKEQD